VRVRGQANPHQPGISPALGLRAWVDAPIVAQTNAGRSAFMQSTPISSRSTLVNEGVLCRRRVLKGSGGEVVNQDN